MKEIRTGVYDCGSIKGYWVRVCSDNSIHFVRGSLISACGAEAISKYGPISDIKQHKRSLKLR